MMATIPGKANDAWWISNANECGQVDLDTKWWRIPLYLLCCAGVLGQYRLPIRFYWQAMVIQLVGYEVQYQVRPSDAHLTPI